MKSRNKVQTSSEDMLLYTISNICLCILLIIIAYPLIYIVSSSFSSGRAVTAGRVVLWPVQPTLDGYKAVFAYKTVITGYRNTILYTSVGTVINVMVTLMAAFPLSRKNFQGRRIFMTLFIITMFFSGGLIPAYILITQLKLINSMWAIILPGTISTYNLIVTRTFFVSTIPMELEEASKIDGCNDFRFFFTILLPLSKAIIAVITLYYGVAHWNAWFNAMLYLRNPELRPLQLVLREILIITRMSSTEIQDPEMIEKLTYMADLMKYSLIVVSSAPIIMIYPFVQKFFITGVMIGSVKG